MKLFKFLVIAVMFCMTSMANAQTTDEVTAIAKDKTEKLTTALDLTEDQQVLAYRQIYTMELNTMKFNSSGEMTPKMTESYKQYQKQFKDEMLAILTDEQRANFEKVWDKKINK
jgi:hypothetical protein